MTDRKQEPLPIKFALGNNLCASVAAPKTPTVDEEIVADADEPADNCCGNLLTGKLHRDSYKKHVVHTYGPHRCDSLLTKAIISDSEPQCNSHSIGGRIGFRLPKRGMSTTSTRSTASMPSTADLTSDGDSSASDLSSPSPRAVPIFNLPITANDRRDVVAIKCHSEDEISKAAQSDPNTVVEALGRKRCITFACNALPLTRHNSEQLPPKKLEIVEPVPRRASALKFACTVKEASNPPKRLTSPAPPVHRSPVLTASHLKINTHQRRDSAATVVDERNGATPRKVSPPKGSLSDTTSIPRFYEFASSVDESVHSWMNAPQFPSRLLKVDGLLEKEKKIQKLSQEVDDEVALEDDDDQNEDDEEDDLDNLEFEESDEDDGYKEDEEDDEHDYEMWSDSDDGNRSDDEEGVAESDNGEEDLLLANKTGTVIPDGRLDRPICCQTTSDSSVHSLRHNHKRGLAAFHREKRTSIRPSTPELPDSTDFVPGTFDEDKVLEDFYLSCMEERKTANKVVQPQDIDPSFPTEEFDEEEEESKSPARLGRRRGSTVRQSSHSRSPRGSPAPNRRLRSPPPMSRRSSRNMSPLPNKRRSSFNKSPPPQGRKPRFLFNEKLSFARSSSLPRHGPFARKKCLGMLSTSPKPSKAIRFRQRGALDIVKGLERKRMRRREHLLREHKCEAGEGVEKMRELGILGRERLGANPQPKWMISV